MNTQRAMEVVAWVAMLIISIWFSFGFIADQKPEVMDTAWVKLIAQVGIVMFCMGLPAWVGMLAGILSIWVQGKMNRTWVVMVSVVSWIALLFVNPWLP